MTGTYRHLEPGRYRLAVDPGVGPAGVRRREGGDIVVGIEGGSRSFDLHRGERVYYWWRGPAHREGVRLERESPHAMRPLATAQSAKASSR